MYATGPVKRIYDNNYDINILRTSSRLQLLPYLYIGSNELYRHTSTLIDGLLLSVTERESLSALPPKP